MNSQFDCFYISVGDIEYETLSIPSLESSRRKLGIENAFIAEAGITPSFQVDDDKDSKHRNKLNGNADLIEVLQQYSQGAITHLEWVRETNNTAIDILSDSEYEEHSYEPSPIVTGVMESRADTLWVLFNCYSYTIGWQDSLLNAKQIEQNCLQLGIKATHDIDWCWAFIQAVSSRQKAIRQRLVVDPVTHSINMVSVADCFSDALIYQLLLHIKNGKSGLDGHEMVRCAICNNLFIRSSRHRTMCDRCASPSEKMRRSRARQKQAVKEIGHN